MSKMRWIKKGLIFNPQDNGFKKLNYAALPVCELINNEILRIYFSYRDEKGRSIPLFLETEPEYPENVFYLNESQILNLGNNGTFDDNGIMPSCIVNYRGLKYLYYIGWNPQVTVSYRLSIGLAISEDGGKTFIKISEGPIMDRSIDEPYFNTTPYVIFDNGLWRMWYSSCTGWKIINNWPEPFYNVKYAVSNDGINWRRTGIVCIDYDRFTQAIGKPCVIKENGIYKMFYSFRNATDYRNNPKMSYRLGYAESNDGIKWVRKDELMNLKPSKNGWDSIMNEYCSIYYFKGRKYMVYNGNGFGKTGFGYAICENEK